jgi:acyl-coenzyme A thioesterase PaaI-like protein
MAYSGLINGQQSGSDPWHKTPEELIRGSGWSDLFRPIIVEVTGFSNESSIFVQHLIKMKHKVLKKQHISRMCFVCGVKNDFGLHANFYETDASELIALINPSEQHQGYPGRMHGGIAAAILDETIGRSICSGKDEQIWSVTLELKTRFRKPIPLGQELKIVARITSEGNRSFEGTGEIVLPNGEIAVSAEGKYMKVNIEKIADISEVDDNWFLPDRKDDPSEIEIP